ncbi:MAG: caspase family protein [Siphonobacter sp.]
MKKSLLLILFLITGLAAFAQKENSFKGDWVTPRKTILKPVVVWQYLGTAQLTVDKPVLKATVCIQSAEALTAYKFIVNGKATGGQQRGFKKVSCGQEVTDELPLINGSNEIHFVATNAGGTTITESHYVTYASAVTTPAINMPDTKRVALIVANQTYSKYPLKNPVNDGQAIREHLEKLGFTVFLRENQSRKELKKAVDEFTASLTDKCVSLFFYAGHGLMVNGDNYVQPIDADPTSESDVSFECFPLRQLVARMEEVNPNGSNLVFWDACRNNPYRSWKRGAGDVSHTAINPPVGTMIIYATEPGKAALDGDEKNGLFTSELVRHIDTPDLEIRELIERIDFGLEKRGFRQPPYTEGRFRGKFTFNPSGR